LDGDVTNRRDLGATRSALTSIWHQPLELVIEPCRNHADASALGHYVRGGADKKAHKNLFGDMHRNLGAIESASVLSRRVRMGAITTSHARTSFSAFDAWSVRATQRLELSAADIAIADAWLRRLDLPLRTLDALHIAIAQRLDATLVTFDQRMAASARALGMAVATP
jgi:predicted nucleic acid-binding protein